MGILWEAYHKGVPLLGVPENPTELMNTIIFSYQAMDDDSEAKATDLRVEVTMLRTSMEVHDKIQPTGCVQ